MAEQPFEKQYQLKKELVAALNTLLTDPQLSKNDGTRIKKITDALTKAHIPQDDHKNVVVYVLMMTTLMPEIFNSAKSHLLKKLSLDCMERMESQPHKSETHDRSRR